MTAEKSPEFKNAQEKLHNRRLAAKKAVATKLKKLLAEIEKMEVSVSLCSPKEVKRMAIQSYNDYNADTGKYASHTSDSDFLQRIYVNFVRHELTEYDYALYEIAGKTGIQDGVSAIRSKVFEAIAKAYPEFKQECERQHHYRQDLD
jgi:hypothetical protein